MVRGLLGWLPGAAVPKSTPTADNRRLQTAGVYSLGQEARDLKSRGRQVLAPKLCWRVFLPPLPGLLGSSLQEHHSSLPASVVTWPPPPPGVSASSSCS